MNLQEHIHRIKEMMGLISEQSNQRHIFNIEKLVKDGIIFLTKPGDGKGGITEPNWAGDCSVLTLPNIEDSELKTNPWRVEALKNLTPECAPHVQKSQDKWSQEKYDQVIKSISILGKNINDYIVKQKSKLPENETKKIDYKPSDFKNSKITDVVWRAGDIKLNPRGGGIWFGETKGDVEKFALSVRGEKRTGKPYVLIIKNPKYYDRFWYGYLTDVEPKYKSGGKERELLMNKLISEGYDGIVIDTDTWNDTGDENAVTSKQYVVFDPTQVIPV